MQMQKKSDLTIREISLILILKRIQVNCKQIVNNKKYIVRLEDQRRIAVIVTIRIKIKIKNTHRILKGVKLISSNII